ncbi:MULTISPECIES: SapB/AmfS family lanthipeptide [unclassified Plantibacter]
MSHLLNLQTLKFAEKSEARTVTSTASLALCGSSISFVFC